MSTICQAEVQADDTTAKAVGHVKHNVRTLVEQLNNAAKVARERGDRIVARDLELLEGDALDMEAKSNRLFAAMARVAAREAAAHEHEGKC